jgi:hypothetical protein
VTNHQVVNQVVLIRDKMLSTTYKKTKKRSLFGIFAVVSCSFLLANSAHAGLITQHVSVGAYDRSCPGLSDPNFVDDYKVGIEAIFGSLEELGAQAVDVACVFNSNFQAARWNNDGSPKFGDLPSIPAFTNEEVGELEITEAFGTNNLSLTTDTGNLKGDVFLDDESLGLPVIKIDAKSEVGQRNSFNGYAATEYLWTGADQTLEFGLDFDFYHSSEMWTFDGYQATNTSDLLLTAFVSEDLIINPLSIFPEDNGNVLSLERFQLSDSDVGMTSAEDPYFGSLNVSFDVTNGQRFFVVGQFQGFAKNGGFLNAYNTITGSLNVEGLTEEESEVVFATSLQLAPAEITAPASMFMLLLSAGLMFVRRHFAN